MIETFKTLVGGQLDAALQTLDTCIERCPDGLWGRPIARYPFAEAAFHTVFFTDYYLGPDAETLRDQPFHREHTEEFGDYEELQPVEPLSVHPKAFVRAYLQHCRRKATEVLAAETAGSLAARTGFERRNFSRAELYVYNIRHVQHHSAQLILRLRLDTDVDIPWFNSGWQ